MDASPGRVIASGSVLTDDARVRRSALVLCALALAGAASGCGGAGHVVTVTVNHSTTVAKVTTVGPVPAADRGSSCTVFNRGTEEYVVVVAAAATQGCLAIIRRWSNRSGDFWSFFRDPTANYANDAPTCSMRHLGTELDVYDNRYLGDHGSATCGALASAGWAQVG